MSDKNQNIEEIRNKLSNKPKNGYGIISDAERAEMNAFCEEYKAFLNIGKTERECVNQAICEAEAAGFHEYKRGDVLKSGDKIYINNRGKSIILAVIGSKDISSGANIAAAHIDAPRIDLKQNPLYQDNEFAMFKTHYYGGIKKYQWPAIPLELRGVIALKSGETVSVSVGDKEDDPILTITDLLPHLGKDQMAKTMSEGFTGENLNLLVGSEPISGGEGESDGVKLNLLKILNDKYGIVEEDFLSAELSVVPAFKARDLGLDRSMIGAYGHDDRVCAYPALRALLELEAPEKTAICVLADKEEIGSEGVSGMKSKYFDAFMEDLCVAFGTTLRECYDKSCCVSADVTVGFDPNFPEVLDLRNAAKLNYGIALCKYTGSRGKSGASDASAELVARMRRIFDGAGALWQMGSLGKVDQGGGGTVAMYMAERNIDTIDAGVPVLSMHAPFEVVSKLDVYMTKRAVGAFYSESAE